MARCLSGARTLACGIQEKLKILVLLVERLLGLSALWPGPGRKLDCGSKVRPREAIWVRESGEWMPGSGGLAVLWESMTLT